MSALGHKQTFAVQNGMSALPPIADMIAPHGLPNHAENSARRYPRDRRNVLDLSQLTMCRPPQLVVRPRPLSPTLARSSVSRRPVPFYFCKKKSI